MNKLIKSSFLIIAVTSCLFVTGCGDRWPTSSEMADAFLDFQEEVATIKSAKGESMPQKSRADYIRIFENADRKWKEKNKVTGITEFNYQFGGGVVTFYWFDYGEQGGKQLNIKMKY